MIRELGRPRGIFLDRDLDRECAVDEVIGGGVVAGRRDLGGSWENSTSGKGLGGVTVKEVGDGGDAGEDAEEELAEVTDAGEEGWRLSEDLVNFENNPEPKNEGEEDLWGEPPLELLTTEGGEPGLE
jgi:hypothetical protein